MASKVKVKKSTELNNPRLRRGRTSISTLSVKNQVTIPVEVLRSAGIKAGDKLEFKAVDGKVEIAPAKSRILGLVGIGAGYYGDYDFERERRIAWGE